MRSKLVDQLKSYSSDFQVENEFRRRFLKLLEHERAFHRDHLPGHITGSAWIVEPTYQFVLLTHHAKLNRWLQPGGHADGDENVLQVALREAHEETGLKSLAPVSANIFDIDIHTIPARKDFPEHDHYDIRFLFMAPKDELLLITAESIDLQWVKLFDVASYVANSPSIMRMAEKTSGFKRR